MSEAESVLSPLWLVCDSWAYLAAALAAVVALSLFKTFRPFATALLVPVALLLFRKVALYIPVVGALSTEDTVIFWSKGALVYFIVLLAVYAFAFGFVYVDAWKPFMDTEVLWAVLFCVVAAPLVASGVLLPVDGWSHLSLGFVAHASALKLLLVNPLLVPLSCLTVFVHVALGLLRAPSARREVNKFLLVSIIVFGVANVCLQVTGDDSLAGQLQTVERSYDGSSKVKETSRFMRLWADKLEEVRRCGVNMVDRASPTLYTDCRISRIADSLPRPLDAVSLNAALLNVAALGLCLVFILVLAERLPSRDSRAEPAADSPPRPATGGGIAPWKPAPVYSFAFGRDAADWCLITVAIPLALMALWLYGYGDTLLELGGITAGAWTLFATGWLLYRELILPAWNKDAADVIARDRKGRRVPGVVQQLILNESPNLPQVMRRQPTGWLLAIHASRERFGTDTFRIACAQVLNERENIRASGAAALASHPACSVPTLVDFATGEDAALRASASALVPADLWPRAVRKLLRSRHAEARLAATRCERVGRRVLVALCVRDPDAAVRASAWRRVEADLTREEAVTLLASLYEDTRLRAVESGRAPRELLLKLLRADEEETVREAAWTKLRPVESAAEADFLSRSTHAEVRLRALQSGELPLSRIRQMRGADVDRAVRQLAFQLSAEHLTRVGAWFLSFNKYADVRRRVVSSGKLPARRLLRLSERDSNETVRKTAWQILNRDLSAEEAEALLSSDNLERRAWAVLCESISRQRLLEICAEDWQAEARAAALGRLQRDLTAREVEVLSRSDFAEVSLFAAGSRMLSRARLSEMCVGAPHEMVRRAAWGRLSDGLTPAEAEALSRSRHADVRANAVNSGLLSEKRLAQLAVDPTWQVRRAVGEQRATRPAGT